MRKLVLLAALTLLIPQVATAQDEAVARGETAFRACGGCHSIGEGAVDRMGPQLNDVMGAQAGSRPGFAYSEALVKKGAEEGVVWNHDTMTQFLRAPREFVPGTKMSFAGIRDDERIDDIIAYLASFSPDYDPEEDTSKAPADAEETAPATPDAKPPAANAPAAGTPAPAN